MAKTQILKNILKNAFKPHAEGALEPTEKLKEILEQYFSLRVFPVNSGRSAIYLFLKAAEIGKGDEVIIQAYTCNAVPNPVVWTEATPIYADIKSDTLNVDPAEVEKKISGKTRAVILQHTMGRPGPIEEILEIAKKHDLLVLEDCAHALGGKHNGRKLGTFGDAAIVSFGREKVISSLAGGAILVKTTKLLRPVIKVTSQLPNLPIARTGGEFFNFFAWRLLLRKIYFRGPGEKLIKNLNKYDFFNVVTSKKEKIGERPNWYPASMTNIFAQIAADEFENLEKYNSNRRKIAEFYLENVSNPDFKLLSSHEGVYLRVVALHKEATRVLSEAKKRKFWFGNWYNTPVYPKGVDEGRLGYKMGDCPVAETTAEQTINLPNHLGMDLEESRKIVEFVNNFH
ncbi:MAG: aminotransferase class V-fold PLP-dependent enzyme [Candidatus Woykebacteria bacterium]